jgi:hypothetical protein
MVSWRVEEKAFASTGHKHTAVKAKRDIHSDRITMMIENMKTRIEVSSSNVAIKLEQSCWRRVFFLCEGFRFNQ